MIGPASERAGFPRYAFGLGDEKIEKTRQPLDSLPTTDNAGKAKFNLTIEKQPEATRPLEAQLTVRMAEAGGRAVERKIVVPVMPSGPMIGVKPLFSGSSLGEGENATPLTSSSRRLTAPRSRAVDCARAAQGRDPLSMVSARY